MGTFTISHGAICAFGVGKNHLSPTFRKLSHVPGPLFGKVAAEGVDDDGDEAEEG